MAEETVWTGTSSQLKNLGVYLVCFFLVPVGLVISLLLFHLPVFVVFFDLLLVPYVLWRWLVVRSRVFHLTTERLLTTDGIISKTTESLELYRVKDLRMRQSVFERIFSLETVEVISSDAATPELFIDYIPKSLQLGDKLREQVEACRVQKRTREIDLE